MLLLRDCEHFAVDAAQRFTKSRPRHVLLTSLVPFNAHDVIFQVCVRVWEAIREEYSVMVVLELVGERQSVVVPHEVEVFTDLILEVADVCTRSVPASDSGFRLLVRIH